MATKTRTLSDYLVEGGVVDVKSTEKPHIELGVLYPSVANIMLDGTTALSASTTGPNGSTVTSSKYGTVQSDGRMYYYTDIVGSKPIKDPRIGAHFGSQRHKTRSTQLLEQETAIHGSDVLSIDGREWMRWVKATGSDEKYDSTGHTIKISNGDVEGYVEFVGYFSDANISIRTETSQDEFSVKVDGGSPVNANLSVSAGSPLTGRYIDSGSVINLGDAVSNLPVTLGIHTVRIVPEGGGSNNIHIYSIELIAQDTTSTATKSQIQIPSQNVVSYGKKFTVSGTPHYNPFATKGDGSASTIPNNTTGDSVATGWAGSTSAYWDSSLDTATSLGLSAWVSGGNYYRPVNGGRVVKWIDSTGAIKTSVNMMPPEGHTIVGAGTNDATGTHNWSSKYIPTFGNKTVGSDLITNGTFTSTTTGWAVEGDQSISSVSGGQAGNCLQVQRGSGATQTVKQTYASFVLGKYYRIAAYIKNGSASSAKTWMRIEGAAVAHYEDSCHVTTSGSFVKVSFNFQAKTSSYEVMLRSSIGTNGQNILWDTVTLHEIESPDSLSEPTKTFHFREYGNGNVNADKVQGSTGGSWKDLSMFTGGDQTNVSYCMDDGLTAVKGQGVQTMHSTIVTGGYTNNGNYVFTFIGTGLTLKNTGDGAGTYQIAKNLPYGTHSLYYQRTSTAEPYLILDGGTIGTFGVANYAEWNEVTFHQPKKPPIPEDACIIADYMLMADFVPQAAQNSLGMSKGCRQQNCSRDIFYNATSGSNALTLQDTPQTGFKINSNTTAAAGVYSHKLPAFATNFVHKGYNVGDRAQLKLNGSNATQTVTTGGAWSHVGYITAGSEPDLGQHNFETTNKASKELMTEAFEIATPTHTSSHYQTFESPFLHELVGGDRNMEQNNLIVTADGKSWDEVTRDTSYLGKICVVATWDTGNDTESTAHIMTEWRGKDGAALSEMMNKDFAIAYDRVICLVDGEYQIYAQAYENDAGAIVRIFLNGSRIMGQHNNDAGETGHIMTSHRLKRGDYVQILGRSLHYKEYNRFIITRV